MLSIVGLVLGLAVAPFLCLALLIKGQRISGAMVKKYLLMCGSGFGYFWFPFMIFNGLTVLWGWYARVSLGMSEQAMLLAQAQQEAERERARAERLEQQRHELMVNISHDLRTPLASIRGHVESLLVARGEDASQSPAPATLYKYLTIIHRETLRLGSLVEDLLSLARAEKQELRLEMSAVAADEVVEEVYQTLMPLAWRERQIKLIRTIASGLPPVRADRQRLLQVLLNLVRNAITYTPDGGIVSLILRPGEPGYLHLLVVDTGIGIAPEDQRTSLSGSTVLIFRVRVPLVVLVLDSPLCMILW